MEEVMTIPMTVDSSPSLTMNVDMAINVASGAVNSVNGQTGDVVLTAEDVGALPSSTEIPTKTSDLQNDSGFLTSVPSEYVTDTELQTAISGKANTADLATVATSGDYDDLLDKPTIPTKTSDLENDSGFLSSAVTTFNGQTGAVTYNAPVQSVNSKTGAVTLDASDVGAIAQETDPTVPSWAKQPNKPTYTASEVGALPDTYTAPVSSVNGQTGAVVIGNATTASAGLMSAQDKTDLGTLMDDYSSALTALGVI